MGEEGEYQLGAVVAYVRNGEPHLAWREPSANQDEPYHWHVLHSQSYGWRTWAEISKEPKLRFLGVAS